MLSGSGAARSLPIFPWDRLAPFGEIARQHPDGIIDLSIGTPVDSTPEIIRQALADASDAPGYPTAAGTLEFRTACVNWLSRIAGATNLTPNHVIPSIGSKEMVAWLPTFLGFGPREVIAIPATAYPTYDVGARIAGCHVVTADGVVELESARTRIEANGRRLAMVWLNSPANPTGRISPAAELAAIVAWGRTHNVIVVSDECYLELSWDQDIKPISVLHPSVIGDDARGVIAVHSLSKRSNLAGYRAGFIAGDLDLINQVLEIRKHGGNLLPAPIQHAAAVALDDQAHVDHQREIYRARRSVLLDAFTAAGFEVHHSEAGLYLWMTRGENCWDSIQWLADRGILLAPGSFYGEAGDQFVRAAFTATDSSVAKVASRLMA
jgi:succinyldiaminopimelate transaminase